jgi:hypothetical protein
MVYLRAGHAGRRPSYLFGLNACHVHVHGSFIRRGRGGAASRALWLLAACQRLDEASSQLVIPCASTIYPRISYLIPSPLE